LRKSKRLKWALAGTVELTALQSLLEMAPEAADCKPPGVNFDGRAPASVDAKVDSILM
jgi:hypothetical protein